MHLYRKARADYSERGPIYLWLWPTTMVSLPCASFVFFEVVVNGKRTLWSGYGSNAYAGSSFFSNVSWATEQHTATFAFTDLTPGAYRVHAVWRGAGDSSIAPFNIYDGGSLIQNIWADQGSLPNDLVDAGIDQPVILLKVRHSSPKTATRLPQPT